MKILNIGSCNIDYVYTLNHIVAPGETETSSKMETFPGGKGLNQSIAAARAGAKVYHAGCVGEGSEFLTDILYDSNVDISLLKKLDMKNGHAVIQVASSGENSIFLYPGSNEALTKEYIDSVIENFDKGDILLLQNEVNLVSYAVDKAYEKGIQVVLNPSPYNEKIGEIDFNKLSYIILNEVEASALSGKDDAKDALYFIAEKYPDLKVMLTLGKKGCIYKDSETEVSQNAFTVKAVDTTAAGDTFTGYFLSGITEGKEISEILKTASRASAIAVSKMGAAPSIPEKAEVEKFNCV